MWEHKEAHPGEYLRVRFLEPLQLSASALAAGCHMPRSRVSDILNGKRGISADTARRLGAFFRMEPECWMALQSSWELGRTPDDSSIEPLDPPGFLLGPRGATPLVVRRPARPRLEIPPASGLPLAAEAAHPPYGAGQHREVRYPDGTRALVASPHARSASERDA
ncbi:MAG: HigA family addiction module antidote protein [Deltaproteobacteria bacterium]|nr:HigA family addiction module antidote protein [Deltaproteobacteria bacterium]